VALVALLSFSGKVVDGADMAFSFRERIVSRMALASAGVQQASHRKETGDPQEFCTSRVQLREQNTDTGGELARKVGRPGFG
jgi:hypothetical protein